MNLFLSTLGALVLIAAIPASVLLASLLIIRSRRGGGR